jgi:hypothetical protein
MVAVACFSESTCFVTWLLPTLLTESIPDFLQSLKAIAWIEP